MRHVYVAAMVALGGLAACPKAQKADDAAQDGNDEQAAEMVPTQQPNQIRAQQPNHTLTHKVVLPVAPK